MTNLKQYLKYVKEQTDSKEFILHLVSSYNKKHAKRTSKWENQEFGEPSSLRQHHDLKLHAGYLINGSCNSKGESFSKQVTTLLGFLLMGLLGEEIQCI